MAIPSLQTFLQPPSGGVSQTPPSTIRTRPFMPKEAPHHYSPPFQSGHIALARPPIATGADPNAKHKPQLTPLQTPARSGHIDLARLLIEKGADPNARA